MEQLYKEGYAKSIGVCNFKEHHFEELMQVAEIKPMVCQIESHPLFPQNDMLMYCKKKQYSNDGIYSNRSVGCSYKRK